MTKILRRLVDLSLAWDEEHGIPNRGEAWRRWWGADWERYWAAERGNYVCPDGNLARADYVRAVTLESERRVCPELAVAETIAGQVWDEFCP